MSLLTALDLQPQEPDDEQQLPAIADDVEDDDKTLNRIVEHFCRYRDDDRRRFNLFRWRAVYRAYHGLQPLRADPYRQTYFIREIFRQIETLKPLIVEQFLPGDDMFKYLSEHPGEEDAKEAATRIVHKQIRSAKSGNLIETEMMKFIEGAIMYGTSYMSTGWAKYRFTRRKPMIQHLDTDAMEKSWDRDTEEVEAGCPYAEHLNPWEVFCHPEIDDPRQSPFFFVQKTCTVSDLHTLAAEGYLDSDACKAASDDIAAGSCVFPQDQDVDFTRPDYSMMYNVNLDVDTEGDGPHELLVCWTSNGWEYVILDRKHLLRAQRLRDGKMPIHCLRNYPQEAEHWGIPEALQILEEQRLLNDYSCMYADSVKYCTTPMVLTKRGKTTTDWKNANFRPGNNIPVDNPDDIRPLAMPPAPQNLQESIGFVRTNMMLGTGITNELSGSGSEATTATGQVHLEQAANKRIQHKIRWFQPAMRGFYRDLYDLNGTYLNEEVRIRYEGSDGTVAFKTAGPEAFADEVEVQLADVIASSPEMQNSALQMFTMLNGDPMTNQLQLRINLQRAFGNKKPQTMINNPAAAQTDALKENQDWIGYGVVPAPNQTDDHATHMQIHSMALHIPDAPPNSLGAMVAHIRLHQEYLAFQQKQAAMAPPPGGPPGAPPPTQNGQQKTTPPKQIPKGIKPEANARTEATFQNGMTGAARNGALPKKLNPPQTPGGLRQ